MKALILSSLLILSFSSAPLRCETPTDPNAPLSREGATALAEKFVAEQSYGDLQRKAVGARLDSGIWFVGFQAAIGTSIHGIMVMNNGKKLKRVNQNLKLDWLTEKPETLAPLTASEAKALAEKFAASSKGLAKKASKTTENKASAAGDSWNSWWVWFEKSPAPGVKKPSYAIVSVNKETHQTKWVKSDGKPVK
ncbi:MAG: hypothetical protein AAB036_04895 [Elusimicrobiota bacterium]